jgi:hypothetical protein
LAKPSNVHCLRDCCNRHSCSNLDKMGPRLTFCRYQHQLRKRQRCSTLALWALVQTATSTIDLSQIKQHLS